MSDETQEPQQPAEAQPADDSGDEVILTKAQLKAMENSIWAESRRHFTSKRNEQPAQSAQPDPRVQRGLELLSRYESAAARAQEQQVERDAVLDASGFGQRVKSALDNVKIPGGARGSSAQQSPTPAPPSELSQLVELMKLDIQSRMADKLPKAPVAYASPMDAVRAEINEAVAGIPEDDPARHTKIQKVVTDRLKGVKVTPGKHNPSSVLVTKKG